MKQKGRLKKVDYRHFILLPITLGFIALGLVFHQALPRLGEAFRNLAVSFAYYVTSLGGSSSVRPTVTQMPSWQFAPSRFERLRFLPWTWEEFQTAWGQYWQTWASLDNLEDYFAFLGDAMFYLSKGLLVLTMVLPLLFMLSKMCLKGKKGERYSKPLKNWQSFSRKVLLPFKKWLKDFAAFFNETSYKQIWILLWVLYFNIPAIVVDFFAYYLYFVPSFDVASLYGQLLKLTVDLAPMVRFIPVLGWIIIGFVALNAFCRNQAFDTLDHCERKNAGFINERGVVTIVYGKMGVGKTALLTSMALTEEANMRRMALEVLLENDIKFPHFPWDRLRAEIKQRLEDRRIVDARYSVESWLRPLRQNFEWFAKHPESAKWLHRNAVKRNFFDYSFGYDFDLYPTTYNDELSLTKLYDAIEDYTKAYVVYAVDTSLILANYSIRTDALREELNYFPVWNHDFFARDVRLQEAHSRYCHILDFDMLRLGKRMKENNINRNAFGFGVYVVSEIDKERKNQNDLKEMKVKEETCNQRNDLFNSCLKMSRHACVIGNRVFLKIFCDLQRPEDWGAGGREVGEVVFIDEKGPLAPVLPFFSPFWLCEGIYKVGKKIYDKICVKHLFPTFEKTLTAHALKSFFAKLDNHYTKVNNLFGCQVLNLKLESGTLDGPVKECKYYRMPKKDFSKRYSTNCLSAIFDGAEPNTVSIADLPCYASIMANNAELAMQNSHFQRDISSMKSA